MEIDDELKALMAPQNCALVIWDVQNMLVNTIFNKEEFLEVNNRVITLAHDHKVPIFFSKITPLPDRFESVGRKYFGKRRTRALNLTPDGLDLTLQPQEMDVVLNKNTASIFIGTNFELVLRNAGISTILFTGIATEIGVESSARDALNRGFFPVILSDAVSSFSQESHNRSLENLKNMMAVLPSSDLKKIWG